MTDSKLRISELDFDTIKENLKNYLKDQPEFTDYDFDGSGMSVLLDVLAYNTHYGSYYDNVVANESRLESAELRNSIVSKAKELNYVPYSRKAPLALANITAIPSPTSTAYDSISTIVLERGKVFTTTIDNKNYEFVTLQDYVLEKDGNGNFVNQTDPETSEKIPVELYEGVLLEFRYTVDLDDETQKFNIPNIGCDTSTVRVFVQTSATSTSQTEFFPADTFSEPKGTNNAYWLWEIDDEKYNVEFGDGILGAKLYEGNVVIIQYLVTSGTLANGANQFNITGTIQGISNVVVDTTNKAFGGAEIESIPSIKFNAPRSYGTQNRAVTEDDYKFIVKREFPSAESIAVWGGEKNDPPQYGKVFISIKPADGFTLTPVEKEFIANELIKEFNMVSIIPEIVDPEFTFILLTSEVIYNPDATVNNNGTIQALVEQTIEDFNDTVIGQFGADYRHSQLVCAINDTEKSIISNLTTIVLQKQFNPLLNLVAEYVLEYNDELEPNTLVMEGFTIAEDPVIEDATYVMKDDGQGFLEVIRQRPNSEDFVLFTSGTVDYETGQVRIQNFSPIATDETDTETNQPLLRMNAVPVDEDVEVVRNNIMEILEYTVRAVPQLER